MTLNHERAAVRQRVPTRDRLKGAAVALAVQAVLGWLLIGGLATGWRHAPDEALTVFRVLPPSLPPIERRKVDPPPIVRLDVASSPGQQRAAVPATAMPLVIVPRAPSPIVAALSPSSSMQATSGPTADSGAGTGGSGYGLGSGSGTRQGSPARQIGGEIRNSDYPRGAGDQRRGGSVDVRYLVGANGRVDACRIVRSSGSTDLDDVTCRLIRQRFRFKPAQDTAGRRTASWVSDGVDWIIGAAPGQPTASDDLKP